MSSPELAEIYKWFSHQFPLANKFSNMIMIKTLGNMVSLFWFSEGLYLLLYSLQDILIQLLTSHKTQNTGPTSTQTPLT